MFGSHTFYFISTLLLKSIRRPSQKCLVSVILTEKYGSVGRQSDQILIFSKYFYLWTILREQKFRPVVLSLLILVSWFWGILPRFQLLYISTFPENQLERYGIRPKQSLEAAD